MEESDEDIFSVQLPESPESYDEPGTSSCSANQHMPMNSYTVEASYQPPQQDNREEAKGSIVKEHSKNTPKGKGTFVLRIWKTVTLKMFDN